MTKPPEGGLSPQEHLAKPDGRGVSRNIILPKTTDVKDFGAITVGPRGCFPWGVRIAMSVGKVGGLFSVGLLTK
jgi:hypothetical protein